MRPVTPVRAIAAAPEQRTRRTTRRGCSRPASTGPARAARTAHLGHVGLPRHAEHRTGHPDQRHARAPGARSSPRRRRSAPRRPPRAPRQASRDVRQGAPRSRRRGHRLRAGRSPPVRPVRSRRQRRAERHGRGTITGRNAPWPMAYMAVGRYTLTPIDRSAAGAPARDGWRFIALVVPRRGYPTGSLRSPSRAPRRFGRCANRHSAGARPDRRGDRGHAERDGGRHDRVRAVPSTPAVRPLCVWLSVFRHSADRGHVRHDPAAHVGRGAELRDVIRLTVTSASSSPVAREQDEREQVAGRARPA